MPATIHKEISYTARRLRVLAKGRNVEIPVTLQNKITMQQRTLTLLIGHTNNKPQTWPHCPTIISTPSCQLNDPVQTSTKP